LFGHDPQTAINKKWPSLEGNPLQNDTN
jgi:hypothetical protein